MGLLDNKGTLEYEYAKMLKYLNKAIIAEPSGYLIERFGEKIRTAGSTFVDMGLLKISNTEESLNLLKVPDLKSMLKERGQKVTGNKSELVQRVMETYSNDELESLLKERVYLLTEEGKAQIQKNEIFFINDRKMYEFSVSQLKAAVAAYPNAQPNDIFYLLLCNRSRSLLKNNKPQSYAFDCKRLAYLTKDSSKYKDALIYAWQSFYVDMSGLSNSGYVYIYQGDENVDVRLFDELISLLAWSMDDFRQFMQNTALKQTPKLVFSYYTAETMVDIICDALVNGVVDLKKYPHNTPNPNSKEYDCIGGF